ncbi:MAG: sigma-54 dependent transcriptional regulator [Proteobacteria bacterium]|jgi:DNA-binding NtrC family response regulator|nr:sigma-54 dependent transcriptional regulator [Pseudomonadota bacterium]
MANFHLLVVEDDPQIINSLELLLPADWKMTWIKDPNLISGRIKAHAAFVDMHLSPQGPAQGPEIIRQLLQHNPTLEVVAMSGDLSLELMEDCLSAGARQYLAKPFSKEEVLAQLEKIRALWMLRNPQNSRMSYHFGPSQTSQKLQKEIANLVGEPGPLLIFGETGTGKEIVFKALNAQEQNRPAVSVNVSALSENLFESELFGHVKGAFTGADQNKMGLVEAAQNGDLFLDEIEALSLSNQVKLLRFLESGEFKKVGAKEFQYSNCRVIVASNESLNELVAQGKFREDLYFRICGKTLQLTPLRERPEDISFFANYFLSQLKPRINKTWSPEALATIKKYSWPGNLRELKRVAEQAAQIARLPMIRETDVRGLLSSSESSNPALSLENGLEEGLKNFEKEMILHAMRLSEGPEAAAELLKISRSTLYKKLKDHNLSTDKRDYP